VEASDVVEFLTDNWFQTGVLFLLICTITYLHNILVVLDQTLVVSKRISGMLWDARPPPDGTNAGCQLHQIQPIAGQWISSGLS
jgi:hypothetical protein